MCELSPERLERAEERVRLQAINSSVNIGKRLCKLYGLIENDLLGRLQQSCNSISPYKVRGRAPGPPQPWCSSVVPMQMWLRVGAQSLAKSFKVVQ